VESEQKAEWVDDKTQSSTPHPLPIHLSPSSTHRPTSRFPLLLRAGSQGPSCSTTATADRTNPPQPKTRLGSLFPPLYLSTQIPYTYSSSVLPPPPPAGRQVTIFFTSAHIQPAHSYRPSSQSITSSQARHTSTTLQQPRTRHGDKHSVQHPPRSRASPPVHARPRNLIHPLHCAVLRFRGTYRPQG